MFVEPASTEVFLTQWKIPQNLTFRLSVPFNVSCMAEVAPTTQVTFMVRTLKFVIIPSRHKVVPRIHKAEFIVNLSRKETRRLLTAPKNGNENFLDVVINFTVV